MKKPKTILIIDIIAKIMFALSGALFFAILLIEADAIEFDPVFCAFGFFGFIPSIAVFFILKFLKNNSESKKAKIISLIFSILLLLFLLVYAFFAFILSALGIAINDLCYSSENVKQHSRYMAKLNSSRYDSVFKHFPQNLPDNVQNYYLYSCTDFHGEGTHYLKFKTDKKYIDNIIGQQSAKFIREIPYDKIDDYYDLLNNFGIDIKSKYTAHILSDEFRTASGIIASDDEIIFFYMDYNIKKSKW